MAIFRALILVFFIGVLFSAVQQAIGAADWMYWVTALPVSVCIVLAALKGNEEPADE